MSYVVSVGKKQLLAGLYWSRLHSPQRKRKFIKEELQELASEHQQVFDAEPVIGTLHSTGIDLLMGVGEAPPGKRAFTKKDKVFSLVCLALQANPSTRSFVGRLRLSDEFEWITVVRSGVVSPVGDLVVGVEEADEALSTLRERNDGLEVLFNEKDETASTQLIESWLEEVPTRKIPQVKDIKELGAPPLSGQKMAVFGVVGAVLLSGAYIGFSQYQAYVERQEAKEEAARQAAIARLNSRGPIPTPWEDWAPVSAVAAACLTHHQSKDEFKYGWQEVYWSCDGESVTRNWQRTEVGSYTHLPVEEGFNLTKPNELGHKEELDVSLEPRGEQAIAPKVEVAKILMDAARIHGMAIRLEWGSEETRTYMQGEEQKVERLGYSLNSATISSKDISGVSIVETLRKIPGLRLTGITQEGTDVAIKIEFYTAV